MAKVGVFFSFEFDRDKELYGSFFEQARHGSHYAIRNYSLDEPHPPEGDSWKKEAENKIRQCDIVIVVVGQDTHNAPGVKEEIAIAKRLDIPILRIRPQGSNYGGLDSAGKLIPWEWKKIDAEIDELLGLE